MSELQAAAGEARKLLRLFDSVGKVVAALDRVGSLEQFEQEITARIQIAKEHEATAAGRLAEAEANVKGMTERGQAATDGAGARAKQIVADAERAARDLGEKAVFAVRESQAKVAAAEDDVSARRVEVAAAQRELEGLQKRIAEAQATIEKMLRRSA